MDTAWTPKEEGNAAENGAEASTPLPPEAAPNDAQPRTREALKAEARRLYKREWERKRRIAARRARRLATARQRLESSTLAAEETGTEHQTTGLAPPESLSVSAPISVAVSKECPSPGNGKKPQGGQPGNKNASKAELHALKRTLRVLGSRGIDRRTQVGRALAHWRSELVADLGGEENLSKQEHVLVEQVTRLHLIIESVDGWLFQRKGGMVNHRKHTLLPVVRERVALVTALRGLLVDLGLKRRTREVETLDSIAREYAERGRPMGRDDHRPGDNEPEDTGGNGEG